VPRGVPYELSSRKDEGSSVYLFFAPPQSDIGSAAPDRVSFSDARAP
jgi:hypothetical protein